MNTPTPRTDKVVASDMGDSGFLVDMINHARQLEQELNEAKEYAAGQRVLASAINDAATEMVKERDQLKKQFEISKGNTEAALNSFHAESKQRRSAEAERDTLKRERDEAKDAYRQLQESDNLLYKRMESVEAEQDQLRKVVDEFANGIKNVRPIVREDGSREDWIDCQIDEMLRVYSQLPHVQERKTK